MTVIIEGLVWWGLMVGVWDITLSGTTLPDISAACAAGLVSAVLAVAARRAVGLRLVPRARWVRWLPMFAASLVSDTAAVFGLAVRHLRHRRIAGELKTVSLDRTDPARDETQRALATLTVSGTPGTFVLDTHPEAHELVVHAITDVPPGLTEVVSE